MLNILRSAKSKLTVIELMRSLLCASNFILVHSNKTLMTKYRNKLRQAREESLTTGQHLRSKSEVDKLIKALKNAQLPQVSTSKYIRTAVILIAGYSLDPCLVWSVPDAAIRLG